MLRCFALLVLCCAASAQTPPSGSIAGEVRDPTGKPLENIRLVLVGDPKGRQIAQSSAQGEFRFAALPPARYQLTAQVISEILGTKSILLDSGQDLKVVMTVAPLGSISGRVLDDKGEPVTTGFTVALFAAVFEAGSPIFQPENVVPIDRQGFYSFLGVKPGRSYRVSAKRQDSLRLIPPDPESRQPELAQSWYPAAASPVDAESLVLFPGERRENVDIRLSRRVPICVAAQVEAPPGPASMIYQIEDDHGIPLASGDIPRDGNLRFCLAEHIPLRLIARKRPLYAFASITPGDRDVADLHLSLHPPATLSGVIDLDSDVPAPAAGATILVGTVRGAEPVDVTIPGAFSLVVSSDGEMLDYGFRGTPKGFYVKGAACGGVPIVGRRLPSSCTPELRITVARDGGTLSVQVQDGDGKPVPDVWVVAWPTGAASESEMSSRMWGGPVNALGAFASSIAPGKYMVVATTTWLDLNTETIARFWRARSKATEVEVGPNAAVNLRISVTKVD